MHSNFTSDCEQIYHIWKEYLRRIPVERRKTSQVDNYMFSISFAFGDAHPEGCDASVDNMYDGAINVAGNVCPVEASGLVP